MDLTGTITTHLAPGQPSFATPTPVGPIVPSRPLERDYTHFIYSQAWHVDSPFYQPPTPNELLPGRPGAYCIGDSDYRNDEFGEGLTFIRRWSTLPIPRFDPERAAITYPAWFVARINAPTQISTVAVTTTYFLCGPGGTYTTPDLIPFEAESRVTNSLGLDVSIFSGIELNDGGGTSVVTSPTLTAYKALVAADLASPSSYSLVIDSTPVNYAGNIWARVTRRVKAK